MLQKVSPILHHLCAPFEMLGVIVGGAYGVTRRVGKLQFDVLMRPSLLMQDCRGESSETVAGMDARVGRNLKEGISPLALNRNFFAECPRFMSCAAGRDEAGSVKGAFVARSSSVSEALDGFRPALP
jgi:hypothetical protein